MRLKKKKVLFVGLGLASLITIPTVFGVLSSCSSTKNTSINDTDDNDNNSNPNLDDFIEDDMQYDQNWEQWLQNELKLHVQAVTEKVNSTFEQIIEDLDNLENPNLIRHFDLNKVESTSPTTNYDVGDSVKIQPDFSSSKSNENNESNYKYYWFIDYPNSKPTRNKRNANQEGQVTNRSVFLRATNTPEAEFYDLAKYDDNAIVTCVQIDTNSPFEQLKENSFKNIDAHYWQTTLSLGEPFTISSPSFSSNSGVTSSSGDNMVTYLTTQGSEFEISASCSVNSKYQSLLKYQWFKKDISGSGEFQEIYGATSQVLKGSIDGNDSGIYKCKMYLKHDAQIPSGGDNTYPEYSNSIETQEFKINVVESTKFNDEKSRFDVKIDGKDISENGELNDSLALVQENDSFIVTPHIYLGNVDLNNIKNSKGVDSIKDVTFNWRKADSEVDVAKEELSYSTGKNGELIFKNIKNSDAGSYVCDLDVSFTNGGSLSYTTNKLPITVGAKGEISLRVGNTAEFNLYNGQDYEFVAEAKIPGYNQEYQDKIQISWFYSEKNKDDWKLACENSDTLSLNKEQVYGLKNYNLKVKASYKNSDSPQVRDISPEPKEEKLKVNIIDPKIEFKNANKDLNNLVLGQSIELNASATISTTTNIEPHEHWKPKYQWYKKKSNIKNATWTPIDNQTNSIYNINVDTIDLDNTQYACAVTLDGVQDSTMLPGGCGIFTLNTKDINNSLISHLNIDDFVNHFNKLDVENNSIEYDDVLNCVSKYLGANKSDIELIELKNSETTTKFFNTSSTKDIVITLKQNTSNSWSTSLGNSRKYSTTVTNSGKTLTIRNVRTNIQKMSIKQLTYETLKTNIEKIKFKDKLNENLEKTKIIQEIIKENAINEKFIDIANSSISFADEESRENPNLKITYIKLELQLASSYTFESSCKQNIKIPYQYFEELELYDKLEELLPIEKLANLILLNKSISENNIEIIKENSYFTYSFKTINPNNQTTKLSNPFTYVYDFEIIPRINLSSSLVISNKIQEAKQKYQQNIKTQLLKRYKKENILDHKLLDLSYDSQSNKLNLQLASRILSIDEKSIENLINSINLFSWESFNNDLNDHCDSGLTFLQSLNLCSLVEKEKIKWFLRKDNNNLYSFDDDSIVWYSNKGDNISKNATFNIKFNEDKKYFLSNEIKEILKNLKHKDINIEFNDSNNELTISNFNFGKYDNFVKDSLNWIQSDNLSYIFSRNDTFTSGASILNIFKEWRNRGKNNLENFEKICIPKEKNNDYWYLLKNKVMINQISNLLGFENNINPIAGIYLKNIDISVYDKNIFILFKKGFALQASKENGWISGLGNFWVKSYNSTNHGYSLKKNKLSSQEKTKRNLLIFNDSLNNILQLELHS